MSNGLDVEFESEVGSDGGSEGRVFESAVVGGVSYSVGDLVKYRVSRTGVLPCEKRAYLVAPIKRVEERVGFTDGELLGVSVAFAHLSVDAGDVELVGGGEFASLWRQNHVGEYGVLLCVSILGVIRCVPRVSGMVTGLFIRRIILQSIWLRSWRRVGPDR